MLEALYSKALERIAERPQVQETGGDGDLPRVLDAPLPSLLGRHLAIVYDGSSAPRSERIITCIRVEQREQPYRVYLRARCHNDDCVKTFRADRIAEIFDPGTGELLGNGAEFFVNYGIQVCDTLSVEAKAALAVMTFMAKCDGDLEERETTMIARLFSDWPHIPPSEVRDFVRKHRAEAETFVIALNTLIAYPSTLQWVIDRIPDVIQADGVELSIESQWAIETFAIVDQLFKLRRAAAERTA